MALDKAAQACGVQKRDLGCRPRCLRRRLRWRRCWWLPVWQRLHQRVHGVVDGRIERLTTHRLLGLGGGWQQPCSYRQFVIALEVFGEEPDGGLVLLAAYSLACVRIATNHRRRANWAVLLGSMPSGFDQIQQSPVSVDAGAHQFHPQAELVALGGGAKQRQVAVVGRLHQQLALAHEMGQHRQVARGGLHHLLGQPWVLGFQARHASLVGGAAHGATAVRTSHGGLFRFTINYYNKTRRDDPVFACCVCLGYSDLL